VNGESTLLVSHLSAFSYISGGDMDEASVQGFSAEGSARKGETCMTSLKDAQKLVQKGKTVGWGQLVQLSKNKRKECLGFSTHKPRVITQLRVRSTVPDSLMLHQRSMQLLKTSLRKRRLSSSH